MRHECGAKVFETSWRVRDIERKPELERMSTAWRIGEAKER